MVEYSSNTFFSFLLTIQPMIMKAMMITNNEGLKWCSIWVKFIDKVTHFLVRFTLTYEP